MALEEKELYLDYRVNELRDEIDLFIISTDNSKVITIQGKKFIYDQVEKFVKKIKNFDGSYEIEGKVLFNNLFRPYLDKSKTKILISLDKFLFNIPLDALVIDQKSNVHSESENVLNTRWAFKNQSLQTQAYIFEVYIYC